MAAGEVAIGSTKITKLKSQTPEILEICNNQFADQYNTFQYVVKNLEKWADETTIGKDLRDDMQKLVDTIERLIENTRNLKQKIDEFAAEQEKINNTSNY